MTQRSIRPHAEQVKAILAGRQSRISIPVKPKPPNHLRYKMNANNSLVMAIPNFKSVKSPYEIGDILWVKEAFNFYKDKIYYKADNNNYPDNEWFNELEKCYTLANLKMPPFEETVKWKLSIHMSVEAARIWLEVTDIKVERVQGISADDACNEGVEYWNVDRDAFEGGELIADYKNYMWKDDPDYIDCHFPAYANPIYSFRSLYQLIHGPESWGRNDWVWAVKFKVLSVNGKI
jgi:hypothetical protein